MRNKNWLGRTLGFFGLLVFLLAASVHIVWGAPQAQEGFQEDFEAADLAGWETTPDVTVVEGALRLYGGNFAMRLGQWGDQETQIRFKLGSAEGEFILHYFAGDGGSYNLILMPENLILEKGSGPENVLILAEAPYQRTADSWLDLTLRVDNGAHTISIGEETVLTAEDPDPLRQGGIGFRYFGSGSVDIDRLALTTLQAGGAAPVEDEGAALEPTPMALTPTAEPAGSFLTALQDLISAQDTQMDLLTFVANLLLSVILAYILGRVYIYWGGSLSNRRKFAANFMLMTVTTTFIILVVRSSVALSLGLVGALSIVRFRTAVKEPEELAYLFFAIGIGIGLGDNQRLITLVAFAVAILILGLLKLFRQNGADVNLHLTVSGSQSERLSLENIVAALKPHTDKLKLMRLDETEEVFEAAFLVEFRRVDDLSQAKAAVQALAPGVSITFLDNKGIW